MELQIRAQKVVVEPALREYAGRHLEQALDRFDGRIGRVVVNLRDLNGPRGGVDTRCQIEAEVRHVGRVIVEERATNPYAALMGAARRIRGRLSRTLERRREGRKG